MGKKNPLILMLNYRNQGGSDPEMQLIVKFIHLFLPSFIHCW